LIGAIGGPIVSQSRLERFVRQVQSNAVPKKAGNENDAAAKPAEDRALSDADLDGVSGGAGGTDQD
jgi:hypothetical protein